MNEKHNRFVTYSLDSPLLRVTWRLRTRCIFA